MKKVILIGYFVALVSNSLFAGVNYGTKEMVDLPHPVKVVMSKHKIFNLSASQLEELNRKMLAVFPEKIQRLKREIKKISAKIQKDVLVEKKERKSVATQVKKLVNLNEKMTLTHIDALDTLREILTEKQYNKSIKMSKVQEKNKKFMIHELVLLPHPGKLVKMGKIEVSHQEKKRIKKEIKAVYAPIFQEKIREAFLLEKKVRKEVAKGKTKDELKEVLDKIAFLKREAIDSRIDALNHFKKIVKPQQWKRINRLSYN